MTAKFLDDISEKIATMLVLEIIPDIHRDSILLDAIPISI